MKHFLVILSFFYLLNSVNAQKKDSIPSYSLKYQTTSIYQYHQGFKADYTGDNSLHPYEERALSLTSTLFLDVSLWRGATFTFNPEMSGGEGVSQAKGLGGFPNGETFRIGDAKPVVYLARLLLEQNIEISKTKSLQIVAGKFGLSDYFDASTYSHDPRTQFLNWSLMTHGAWDYAANTRGYTDGIYLNYQFNSWQLRGSLSALPTNANGPNVEFSFDKSNAVNLELEKKFTLKDKSIINLKLLGYRNVARMGSYELINSTYTTATPNIYDARAEGRTKYGLGLNAEYCHGDSWGMFSRISYNDGKNETWAFTEIDQSASLGFSINGKNWNQKNDFVGIAIVANGLSIPHQEYQRLGGNGFMIGDGNLNYGTEQILEAFYSFAVPHSNFTISPDYQFAINPGYNKDRGPVQFFAIRVHTEF